ncbi:MAG: hypothetical protein EZS26_000915, partial [Candidatus Ordinivivax streblomastigis]
MKIIGTIIGLVLSFPLFSQEIQSVTSREDILKIIQ